MLHFSIHCCQNLNIRVNYKHIDGGEDGGNGNGHWCEVMAICPAFVTNLEMVTVNKFCQI